MRALRPWLIVLLLNVIASTASFAQALGVARATTLDSGTNPLLMQLGLSGGLLIDHLNNTFLHQAPGSAAPTVYPSFSAMLSALSGSTTSTSKWVFNSAGVLAQFGANTPATPCYAGDGTFQGLCIEPAATNILLQSAAFSTSPWTSSNVTLTANAAPDPTGGTASFAITEDTSNGSHWIFQSMAKPASAVQYVASCRIAGYEGSRNVILQVDDNAGNGAYTIYDTVPGDAPVVPATGIGTAFTNLVNYSSPAGSSGMVRIDLAFISNTATTIRLAVGLANGGDSSYAGNGTSAIALWGCELKTGNVGGAQTETGPSSYVPTTTTAVTRAIDRITMALPSDMNGLSAYSFLANVTLAPAADGQFSAFATLTDSTGIHRLGLIQLSPSNSSAFALQAVDSSTLNVTMSGPLDTFGQSFSIAAIAQGGNYWAENSGQGMKTSTSTTYPSTPMSILRVGSFDTSSRGTANIGISQLAIYSTALTQTQMQSLLFGDTPYNPDLITGPNYFTQSMINDVVPAGLTVFRVAGMPANDSIPASAYAGYPVTAALSGNIAAANTSSATLTKFTWLFTASRCDLCSTAGSFGTKPNGYSSPAIHLPSGLPTASSFTTYDKASMADLARVLYALNFPGHATGTCPAGVTYCGYLDAANAAGIPDSDVYDYADVNADPTTYFVTSRTVGSTTWMTTVDKIILTNARINLSGVPAVWGISCDCENDDMRPASLTTVNMLQFTAVAHAAGVKFATGSDDSLGVGQYAGFCGIGATAPNCDEINLATIVDGVDAFFLGASGHAGMTFDQAIVARIAQLGTGYTAGHVAFSFPLGVWPGGTTIDNATSTHSAIVTNGFGAIAITPSYGTQGGQQCRYTNLKIAILLGLSTGSCSIPP